MISVTAPVEMIDVTALEKNTHVHVVRDDQIEGGKERKKGGKS